MLHFAWVLLPTYTQNIQFCQTPRMLREVWHATLDPKVILFRIINLECLKRTESPTNCGCISRTCVRPFSRPSGACLLENSSHSLAVAPRILVRDPYRRHHRGHHLHVHHRGHRLHALHRDRLRHVHPSHHRGPTLSSPCSLASAHRRLGACRGVTSLGE
jgi:hypothetical protein